MIKGDKIIAIAPNKKLTTTIGKVYIVEEVRKHPAIYNDEMYVSVINDCGWKGIYPLNNFVTMAEWRELQINSILND